MNIIFSNLHEGRVQECHDPISAALVGSAMASSTAGASVVGLLGAGGVFAPMAGTLMGSLGSLTGIMGLASTGLGGLSGMQESRAAEQSANTNARIATQNAETTRQQNKFEMDRQDRERRLRAGSARAGAGASGLGIESFGDILQSSAAQEELDLLTLKSEGTLKENNFLTESALSTSKAKAAKSSGTLNTASSILGGASKFLAA